MRYLEELYKRYQSLSICKKDIEEALKILIKSFNNGKKLLIAGNGGSASDSDHIAGELLKAFIKKRKLDISLIDRIIKTDEQSGKYIAEKLQGALPVIPLTNNSAAMTACLNDVDGNMLFAQQINGLGCKDDVFLGISTSGNSKDVLFATVVAKAKGLKTILLTGKDGGTIKSVADVSIIVPEMETYKIQELHLPIYHTLCLEIEDYFWKE